MPKVRARCPTCIRSTRSGLLWLGGRDWVECPDCGGTEVLEFHEERFTPRERLVSLPGLPSFVERRLHPNQERASS